MVELAKKADFFKNVLPLLGALFAQVGHLLDCHHLLRQQTSRVINCAEAAVTDLPQVLENLLRIIFVEELRYFRILQTARPAITRHVLYLLAREAQVKLVRDMACLSSLKFAITGWRLESVRNFPWLNFIISFFLTKSRRFFRGNSRILELESTLTTVNLSFSSSLFSGTKKNRDQILHFKRCLADGINVFLGLGSAPC